MARPHRGVPRPLHGGRGRCSQLGRIRRSCRDHPPWPARPPESADCREGRLSEWSQTLPVEIAKPRNRAETHHRGSARAGASHPAEYLLAAPPPAQDVLTRTGIHERFAVLPPEPEPL